MTADITEPQNQLQDCGLPDFLLLQMNQGLQGLSHRCSGILLLAAKYILTELFPSWVLSSLKQGYCIKFLCICHNTMEGFHP